MRPSERKQQYSEARTVTRSRPARRSPSLIRFMNATSQDASPTRVSHQRPHSAIGGLLVLRANRHRDACPSTRPEMGLRAIENVEPKDWPILQRYGLACAMTVGPTVERPESQGKPPDVPGRLRECIDTNAEFGYPNVIAFSGMRRGMPDNISLENTVLGLKQVIGQAERKQVNLCLEVLNSRVDGTPMKRAPRLHRQQRSSGRQRSTTLGSERMKMLFDIYHVQIMQGDIKKASGSTTPRSAITTWPASPAAARSAAIRRSTTRRSCAKSWLPATAATSASRSFPPARPDRVAPRSGTDLRRVTPEHRRPRRPRASKALIDHYPAQRSRALRPRRPPCRRSAD